MERIYTIQNDGLDFFTGVNASGHQVLLGILFPECVAIKFDQAGNFLYRAAQSLTPAAFEIVNGIYYGQSAVLRRELEAFKTQMGFVPQTINIRKFYLEERGIGIGNYPEEYSDEFDLDEREMERQEWSVNQQFVLWWGKDYWMNVEGEVEST